MAMGCGAERGRDDVLRLEIVGRVAWVAGDWDDWEVMEGFGAREWWKGVERAWRAS